MISLAPVCALADPLRLSLLSRAERAHWTDGSATAHGIAREQKRCAIASPYGDDAFSDEAGAALLGAVYGVLKSEAFRDAALPQLFSALRLMRYSVGDRYGLHTDEVLTSAGGVAFRADLSFTIVLQGADVGGFLMVDGQRVVLRDGDVFLYPSTTAHEVTPVVAGQRIVLVGWVQSAVRDHAKREILAQLNRMVSKPGEVQPFAVQAVRNELLRRWC